MRGGNWPQRGTRELRATMEMFFIITVGLLLFGHSVVSDCLWPHGLQHTRRPHPSPSPRASSNSHPLSWWCRQTSSSVIPFSCLRSFPASVLSQQVSSLYQMAKVWSFSISPSNEYLGLISFRMDWLDLLAVQVTLKSLLQHHSSKASILWRSAFFRVQLSQPYVNTGRDDYMTVYICQSLLYCVCMDADG